MHGGGRARSNEALLGAVMEITLDASSPALPASTIRAREASTWRAAAQLDLQPRDLDGESAGFDEPPQQPQLLLIGAGMEHDPERCPARSIGIGHAGRPAARRSVRPADRRNGRRRPGTGCPHWSRTTSRNRSTTCSGSARPARNASRKAVILRRAP